MPEVLFRHSELRVLE